MDARSSEPGDKGTRWESCELHATNCETKAPGEARSPEALFTRSCARTAALEHDPERDRYDRGAEVLTIVIAHEDLHVSHLEEGAHSRETELQAHATIEAEVVLRIEVAEFLIIETDSAGEVRLHADAPHADDGIERTADHAQIILLIEQDTAVAFHAKAVVRQVSAELDRQRHHAEAEHYLTVEAALEHVPIVGLRHRQPTREAKPNRTLRFGGAGTHDYRHGHGRKQRNDARHGHSP